MKPLTRTQGLVLVPFAAVGTLVALALGLPEGAGPHSIGPTNAVLEQRDIDAPVTDLGIELADEAVAITRSSVAGDAEAEGSGHNVRVRGRVRLPGGFAPSPSWYDVGGEPMNDVQVIVAPAGLSWAAQGRSQRLDPATVPGVVTTRTDASGRFELELPASRAPYRSLVICQRGSTLGLDGLVHVDDSEVFHALSPVSGRAVRIVDETGHTIDVTRRTQVGNARSREDWVSSASEPHRTGLMCGVGELPPPPRIEHAPLVECALARQGVEVSLFDEPLLWHLRQGGPRGMIEVEGVVAGYEPVARTLRAAEIPSDSEAHEHWIAEVQLVRTCEPRGTLRVHIENAPRSDVLAELAPAIQLNPVGGDAEHTLRLELRSSRHALTLETPSGPVDRTSLEVIDFEGVPVGIYDVVTIGDRCGMRQLGPSRIEVIEEDLSVTSVACDPITIVRISTTHRLDGHRLRLRSYDQNARSTGLHSPLADGLTFVGLPSEPTILVPEIEPLNVFDEFGGPFTWIDDGEPQRAESLAALRASYPDAWSLGAVLGRCARERLDRDAHHLDGLTMQLVPGVVRDVDVVVEPRPADAND